MDRQRAVKIKDVLIDGGGPVVLIAGPCAIEGYDHAVRIAEAMAEITQKLGMPYIFKSSYDKANRTSIDSFRGIGVDDGLDVLRRIREKTGLPILSDVHEPAQVKGASEAADCLQIPAFLCRQTDLLLSAGRTGKAVNIKKGQFIAPQDIVHSVDKVRSTGNDDILVTERGVSFGYNNLVVDMRSLMIMRESTRCPVVFDATHSVQLPGAGGGKTGGNREFVKPLARAACAVGIDALFLEVHDDPDNAPCDGPNMLFLEGIEEFLKLILEIDGLIRS